MRSGSEKHVSLLEPGQRVGAVELNRRVEAGDRRERAEVDALHLSQATTGHAVLIRSSRVRRDHQGRYRSRGPTHTALREAYSGPRARPRDGRSVPADPQTRGDAADGLVQGAWSIFRRHESGHSRERGGGRFRGKFRACCGLCLRRSLVTGRRCSCPGPRLRRRSGRIASLGSRCPCRPGLLPRCPRASREWAREAGAHEAPRL